MTSCDNNVNCGLVVELGYHNVVSMYEHKTKCSIVFRHKTQFGS